MVRRCAAGQALVAALLMCGARTLDAADDVARATVALVLDTSGSLKSGDLAAARELGTGLMRLLPEGSEIALFTFDDQSRIVLERTADRQALERALAELKIAGRFTVLYDALYDAARYLERAPSARKAVILVTDGRDENSALHLDDALEAARRGDIPILAVGAGRVEERVLRRIAKLTGGQYFPSGGVEAATLAAQIPALPTPVRGAAGPATPQPPGVGGSSPPAVSAPSSSPPAPNEAGVGAGGRRLELMLGLLALVLGTAGLVVFALSRRRANLCPTCDRPLAGPGALCPSCTDPAAEPPTPESQGSREGEKPAPGLADEFSPTVLTRLNATEEYLEKTITLREKPVLAVTRGPGAGEVFNLSTESALSVGRAKANDITIEDVAVSSQHCRVRPEGGGFVLHDLKSTNGTFVNDRRVSRHVLADGDVIKVGETLLQFRREQVRA